MGEKSTAREYNWNLPMKTNSFYQPTTEGRGALSDLARIPKSKSSAAQPHGERTPLACGFWRLAENLVPQTFSRQNRTKNVREGLGEPPKPARGPCALPFLFRSSGEQAGCLDQSRQFSHRAHLQPARQVRPVQFHGPLVDSQIVADLFVQLAAYDVFQHLQFARR